MTVEYSELWERLDGAEYVVCEPIHEHAMAPRHARAILEAAGQLMDQGIEAEALIATWERAYPLAVAREG